MVQQIWPPVQQKVPQQSWFAPLHVVPSMHAGRGAQFPLSQNGVAPEHSLPQSPQLCGSL
jgi:hypothetical protein